MSALWERLREANAYLFDCRRQTCEDRRAEVLASLGRPVGPLEDQAAFVAEMGHPAQLMLEVVTELVKRDTPTSRAMARAILNARDEEQATALTEAIARVRERQATKAREPAAAPQGD